MTPRPFETRLTVLRVGHGLRGVLGGAALLVSAVAFTHCGSSSGGNTNGNGNGNGNGAGLDGGASSADAGLGMNASDASASIDSAAIIINPNGPFCVAYGIMEEFYAAFTSQCTCEKAWKSISDAEDYVALLKYYPGIYGNAHIVASCPTLQCCVHAETDDGGLVPEGCLCSDSKLDCTNDIAQGAAAATSCP